MKNLFLIIGAPGSGKTTDASLIAQRNSEKIAHYSMGELLRIEAQSNSPLGRSIASYMNAGNLVPIEIVASTILSVIKQCEKNYILIDGFPRTKEQMLTLDYLLVTEPEINLVSVIEVVVSEDVACERVLGRARGDDDNVEVFKNRMKVYTQPLQDIEKLYTKRGLLKKIDGERSIEEIVAEMEDFILNLSL